MAACYSADPDGTIHLPSDVTTGQLLPDVWERWLAWDPVRMVAAHAAGLQEMCNEMRRAEKMACQAM